MVCFKENHNKTQHDFIWFVICLTKSKLYKTRATMTLNQIFISSDDIFKDIQKELRRLKTNETWFKDSSVWDSICM